ncbi:MAG: SIR2 family protein [Lachnospiraceae bacterium]|nr:SIR2 family protein [Lachnospiraceae bacterium]
MDKKISWLHLSDLHFRYSNDDFESQLIYEKLLEDLKHIEKPINLVFVTGDIAFSGNEKEYELAGAFFKQVLDILNIGKDALFFVPGNHDIQKSNTAEYISKVLDGIHGEEKISEIIGNKELRELFLKKFNSYYDFVNENSWPTSKSELFYTKNINVNGVDVAIVGLNSAWGSISSSEKGNIVLGERQVLEAFSKIRNPQITITLLHHPIYYFRDEDVESVEKIINRRSDFVLHGHTHNRKVIVQKMPDSVVNYLVAGASYDDNIFNLAYNYVSTDLKNGITEVNLRKFDKSNSSWVSDKLYNNSGKVQFTLPTRLVDKEFLPSKSFYDLNKANVGLIKGIEKVDGIEQKSLVIPSIPKQLLNSIRDGNCVLFAGAGTSMDAKMPSWNELVVALVDCLKEEYSDLSDDELVELEKLLCEGKYLVLAEYCLKKLGKYVFSQVLKQKLSCKGKKSFTHNLMAQIPFKAVITTNFDSFIEQTNAAFGRLYRTILPNDMHILEDGLEGALPIIKIHGSYEDPESIVLTEAGIRELLFNKPQYREILTQYFVENTILFYGYSFKDSDIDFILQGIMADKRGKTRKHYALLPDVGKIEAEYLLDEYNIQAITFSTQTYGYLASREFLENIVKEL